jgi:type IV secretory pathway protease TraF
LSYQNKSFRYKLAGISLFFMIILALVLATGYLHGPVLFWNTSHSAPLGVYCYVPGSLNVGDFCVVKLPRDVCNLKAGTVMLKKVAAAPGTDFLVTDNILYLQGRFYPFMVDNRLPRLQAGKYQVPAGAKLLLNDPDDSFDSRYLGPINDKYIINKVRLLVPFEPVLKMWRWLYEKIY